MTNQENKSAADVAVQIAEQIEKEWQEGKHGPFPSAFKIARVAAQRAIQSETAALREENERLNQELQTAQIVQPMMDEILLEERIQALLASNVELTAEVNRLKSTEGSSCKCRPDQLSFTSTGFCYRCACPSKQKELSE